MAHVALCQTSFEGQYSQFSQKAYTYVNSHYYSPAVNDLIIHEDGHVLLMIKLRKSKIFHFEDAF